MKESTSHSRRVHILRESVARKIAAGEVIDRPFSVVRELLDNSLDAGAKNIEVHLEAGGIDLIRVVDDGSGMSREDLELCFLPHATSKIDTEDDLSHVRSLGFRGEALSAIATVSRLEIASHPAGEDVGHRLAVQAGRLSSLEPHHTSPGTTVTVKDLFYSLPARKRFLKRPSAETAMSRNVFLEKAVPFHHVGFRLFTDGKMRTFLPPGSRLERVASAHANFLDPALLTEIAGSGDGFSITCVTAGPHLYRNDRKLIQIYVNNRRIWEYAFVQAVEYGFSDYLPGGSYPIAFVFIELNPDLVDFNIHPAKREARFRNLQDIHRRLVSLLQGFLQAHNIKFSRQNSSSADPELQWQTAAERPIQPLRPMQPGRPAAPDGQTAFRDTAFTTWAPQARPAAGPTRSAVPYELDHHFNPAAPAAPPETDTLVYHGQIFGLFLLAEVGNHFYIVDQHAGHEKVLYNRFRQAVERQGLLVPHTFETTQDEAEALAGIADALGAIGITLRRLSASEWEITEVPAAFASEPGSLAEVITDPSISPRELEKEIYATMACKAAIKDGDRIDDVTARSLLEEIFKLENARCPHGRPIWFELSRSELFQFVGRT